MSNVELAKRVLLDDTEVQFGIFGFIAQTRFFPPRTILNEFLEEGVDSCDQDRRMLPWRPFSLEVNEYEEIKRWWVANHPTAVEESFGVESWDDWVQEMLEGPFLESNSWAAR